MKSKKGKKTSKSAKQLLKGELSLLSLSHCMHHMSQLTCMAYPAGDNFAREQSADDSYGRLYSSEAFRFAAA